MTLTPRELAKHLVEYVKAMADALEPFRRKHGYNGPKLIAEQILARHATAIATLNGPDELTAMRERAESAECERDELRAKLEQLQHAHNCLQGVAFDAAYEIEHQPPKHTLADCLRRVEKRCIDNVIVEISESNGVEVRTDDREWHFGLSINEAAALLGENLETPAKPRPSCVITPLDISCPPTEPAKPDAVARFMAKKDRDAANVLWCEAIAALRQLCEERQNQKGTK